LAFAVILAAGLKGIEQDYELPPGAEDDVWALTSAERRAMGIKPLPADLNEAIKVMENSELVAETLGEHVFDFFLRNKRDEWQEYRRQVTRYELDRYLPML
ncbi:MAG TPA: glutamine synthetase, partial [Trebonia sp.]|nr:glutamine synthetase [Trebonia sp.]